MAVQSILHPPARLAAWPDAGRGTRLVLITLDMPEDYVRRLFAAVADQPSLDTPDRAALADNPLAIAGYRGNSVIVNRYSAQPRSSLLPTPCSPLDEKPMPAGNGAGLDQAVAEFMTEGGDVDHGKRVGGFQPEPAAAAHARQPFARLQHRQRTVQALEVIDRWRSGQSSGLSCQKCC